MGRTEFLTETDCERALVGRAKAKASTRAKWRSSSSACRRVFEKCLTPPTLLEMGIYQQSGQYNVCRCLNLHANDAGHCSPVGAAGCGGAHRWRPCLVLVLPAGFRPSWIERKAARRC